MNDYAKKILEAISQGYSIDSGTLRELLDSSGSGYDLTNMDYYENWQKKERNDLKDYNTLQIVIDDTDKLKVIKLKAQYYTCPDDSISSNKAIIYLKREITDADISSLIEKMYNFYLEESENLQIGIDKYVERKESEIKQKQTDLKKYKLKKEVDLEKYNLKNKSVFKKHLRKKKLNNLIDKDEK